MKNIDERIKGIMSENDIQKPLVITIGFSQSELDKNKMLLQPIDSKLDLLNLVETVHRTSKEFIQRQSDNVPYFTVRPEEFSLLGDSIKQFYSDRIIVLRNNLYDKSFPYQNTLSDVDKDYKILYLDEDVEPDNSFKNRIDCFNSFYGGLDYSEDTHNYFVTYREDKWDDLESFDYYSQLPEINIKIEDEPQQSHTISLDDVETNFLDFQSQKNFKMPFNFIIETNVDNRLPHHYAERIAIIKQLHPEFVFSFSTSSIKKQHIRNLNKYRNILQKTWQYDDFRELTMYSNIEKKDKKTISISQAQIIDDIVQQAENAKDGKEYRDIYITAPTGSGKSVMFQIPALYLADEFKNDKPLVIIISPLIGLMNDQVTSMKHKNVSNAETINGNTPPYEKQAILENVQTGKTDMLYLSPETLQARSDIKMLIGTRKVGMVIVDEAHIVTTWGKSFRADYWYLGIYLQKLRKIYQFPIVTFTATAIYGGPEDMYADTRNSLNLVRPISYFGLVRRNDISMNIKTSKNVQNNEYKATKQLLAKKNLERSARLHQKTLMYFPTVKGLTSFYHYLKENSQSVFELTGRYFGPLDKAEKDAVLNDFKSGEIQFVLATKAFGMGIDIPDITNVYHYNPTGNVVDYIQEIGRVARNHKLVPQGNAYLDFLPNDFNEVRQLQGMSAIKKDQIQSVMQKIVSLYESKGNNRNLVVSADDFKYIFADNINDDSNNLDNKVKTVLLMIEKDFSSSRKLGYSPFVARPRSVFGKELILVSKKTEETLMHSSLKNYFEFYSTIDSNNYSSVLSVNLSQIWEKYYKKDSFPQFKYKINQADEVAKMQHANIFKLFNFASGVQYDFDESNNATILSKYKSIMNEYQDFIDIYQRSERQFDEDELATFLKPRLQIQDTFVAKTLAQALVNATFEYQKLKNFANSGTILRERNSNKGSKFTVRQSADTFANFVNQVASRLYNPTQNFSLQTTKMSLFHFKSNKPSDFDDEKIVLGLGQAFGLTNFITLGGYNPQIYIRINSISPLEQAISKRNRYRNYILEDVRKRHEIGVEMQKYLFNHKIDTTKITSTSEYVKQYTNWFWDRIEDYFMGELPTEVQSALAKK
ncbi:DEAD/DEAH box helicase [Furfurilactobacillus milii]|nr:DEAD/DEAH box helicase [Furfurilactobacillus milii]